MLVAVGGVRRPRARPQARARAPVADGQADPGSGRVHAHAGSRAHGQADLEAEAARHPFVKQVLDAFPGAEIKDVGPVETEKD